MIRCTTFTPGMATALSFSGGRGSTRILAGVLEGEIARPPNFLVVNSDPGMENTDTYRFVDAYRRECQAAGIPFLTVRRNLYQELLVAKASGRTRFDLPPFWTRNRETGKKGRLLQRCTKEYKIGPMDRAIRAWLWENLGIPRYSRRIGTGTLVKWIGFSSDEWHRIKEAKQKYVDFAYPLIEAKVHSSTYAAWFLAHGRAIPPRSVCSACYANDVQHFKTMHAERPENWSQAVMIDDEIRDLSQFGVKDECFVSSTLVPLRTMAAMNFENLHDQELVSCHSGHCFV